MHKNIHLVSENFAYYRTIVYRSIPKRYYYLADDLAQDAMLKSIKKIDMYDDTKGSFKSWMYRLTQNICFDAIRKLDRIPTTSMTFDLPIEDEDIVIDEFEKKKIRDAIRCLSERDRKMIILRYYYKYSGREIGNVLGIPERQVPSCFNRAKKRLKDIYSQAA